MKAFVVTAYDGPEVMKYEDMPDPKPGAGDVLVRVAGLTRKTCSSATATRGIGIARPAVVRGATTPMCGRSEALDESFPASDPVSAEQRVIGGRVGKLSFSMVSYGRSEKVMERTDAAGERVFRSPKRRSI